MLVIFSIAVLIGIITVVPCAPDCSDGINILGRAYDFDPHRVRELYNDAKNIFINIRTK